MRLIDKAELKEWVENWFYQHKYYHPYSKSNSIPCSELYDILERMPTIDAVEVKHGEWIIDGMNEYELSYGCVGYEPIYRCSKCGITTESYLRTERPIMPEDADFPNYCPQCGAKMDGEEKSDG